MSGRHRVLVVEDDAATAEDICEIIRTLDSDPIVFDNAKEAQAELDRAPICFAVLDLEVKVSPDSLKGNVAAGLSLVREVRSRYPDHAGKCFRVPIVVVSGHARDAEPAVRLMKDGADDVIQKPLNVLVVTERLQQVLAGSGRTTHGECGRVGGASTAGVVISIPGERRRKRTKVDIDGRTAWLRDADLWVLLHLAVANEEGRRVHKQDLGARSDQGFRGISELRSALAPALEGHGDIIENDHSGTYWLREDVKFGACSVDALIGIGTKRITDLAEALRAIRDPKV